MDHHATHIMLLVPGGFDATQFTTDHHSGEPYIMWDDTPYEHLMIPVNTGEITLGHSEEQPQAASHPSHNPCSLVRGYCPVPWPS